MPAKSSRGWWSRNLWVIVLFPCLAALLLAAVGLLRGWLHNRIGFDAEGKPLMDFQESDPRTKRDRPAVKPRPAVSSAATYGRIATDLQRHDSETRPRLRYLTLQHRYNEPSCSDAELEGDRGAVRDLIAILRRSQSADLDFIDPEQVLFRIDLAELGWDAATEWRTVAKQYRYGLGADGNDPLAQLRRHVEQLAQDPIPVVRADWFVVALTRSPLIGPNGVFHPSPGDLPESVRALGRQYSSQTLDLAACARELDLDNDQELAALIRGHENLQQEFGLAPLLQGALIRREWWESDRNLFSPYQELARLLKIGKPVRVQ
jgi:hypothetical protein